MIAPIKHIVMADDDSDDVELFQTALLKIAPAVQLSVAEDGAKLIHLLTYIPKPDCIFIDLNMPCKSGVDCLKEIRSNRQFDDVQVIIYSTSKSREDINYCLANGAYCYIIKPNTYTDITTIVQNLCEGKLESNVSSML